jgi:hypothetical protein
MIKAARGLEIAIGLFFLVTAGMKAIDINWFAASIKMYNVVPDSGFVPSAYITLISETLIGAGLVAGIRLRGLVQGYAVALTLVFTGLIIYAWKVHGLEDCGCFGKGVPIGPEESIAKNAALIGLILWSWWALRDEISIGGRAAEAGPIAQLVAIVGLTAVVGIWAYGNFFKEADPEIVKQPENSDDKITFEFTTNNKNYDLSTGDYLLVFLNTTCEHCIASMPVLNIISDADELPEMVGLMQGTSDDLDDFILETEPRFTTQLIDVMQFTKLVPNAPPWLVYVKDGVVLKEWEWDEIPEMPDVDEVKAAVESSE